MTPADAARDVRDHIEAALTEARRRPAMAGLPTALRDAEARGAAFAASIAEQRVAFWEGREARLKLRQGVRIDADLASRITVRPDAEHEPVLRRVRAGVGDRRVTSWPQGRHVTLAEILAEFADLAPASPPQAPPPAPAEVVQDVLDNLAEHFPDALGGEVSGDWALGVREAAAVVRARLGVWAVARPAPGVTIPPGSMPTLEDGTPDLSGRPEGPQGEVPDASPPKLSAAWEVAVLRGLNITREDVRRMVLAYIETPGDPRCTHGADCPVHPKAGGLHDLDDADELRPAPEGSLGDCPACHGGYPVREDGTLAAHERFTDDMDHLVPCKGSCRPPRTWTEAGS